MRRNQVAVVGAAETTKLGVIPDVSQIQLHADAALNALADCGLTIKDIDGFATAVEQPQQICHYLGITPTWVDNTSVGWKIDHHISSRDTLSGAVNWMDFDNLVPGPIPDGPGATRNPFFNKMINLGHTHTFSPTKLNEARISYQRFNNPQTNPPSQTYPAKDYATELGLTGLPTDPSRSSRLR